METHQHPDALQRKCGQEGGWPLGTRSPGLDRTKPRPHDPVPQVRDGATLILSKVGVSQQPEDSQQDLPGERESLPLPGTSERPPGAALRGGGSCGSLQAAGPRPRPPQRTSPTGHALLEEENRVWHLVRPTEEVEEGKCKRGSVKEKERTKAITEIYLTRLLSVKVGGARAAGVGEERGRGSGSRRPGS